MVLVIANYFTRFDVKVGTFRIINRTQVLLDDRLVQGNLKTNLPAKCAVTIKRVDVGNAPTSWSFPT